jgi:hypothetical protein
MKSVYNTGTIEYSDNSVDIIEDKVEALRMLLNDKISFSACSKLMLSSKFAKVQYYVGRLYEDMATVYKFIENADKVSFIHESYYCYVIRKNSFTRSSFSEKKKDLILSTKSMCDDLIKKYPELKEDCIRKLMWANFSVLSQIAMSNSKPKATIKEIRNYLISNKNYILRSGNSSIKEKFAMVSLMFGFLSFKLCLILYNKIKGKY